MNEKRQSSAVRRPAVYLGVAVAAVAIVVALLFVPVSIHDGSSPASGALVRSKLLALAVAMYSEDYDDRLPPARAWQDLSATYTKTRPPESLYSSNGKAGPGKKFALFEALSCVSPELFTDISEVPMAFQSVLTERNAHGTLDQADWPLAGRCCVAFLDCHAKAMPKSWRFGAVTINIK